MIDFIQKNPLLSIVIFIAVIWVVSWNKNVLEGFNDCVKSKRVYMNNVSNSMSEGVALLERNNFDELFVSLQANLPYIKAGVFNTLDEGRYHVFLYDRKTNKHVPVGHMFRYGDRFYRLKSSLKNASKYVKFTDILVYSKNRFGDKLVLQGKLNI